MSSSKTDQTDIKARMPSPFRRIGWWILPIAIVGVIGGMAWSRIRQVRLDAELIRAIKAGNTKGVEAALHNGAMPTTVDRLELKLDSIGAYWGLVMGGSPKEQAGSPAIQIAYDQKYWDGVEALVRHGEAPGRIRVAKGRVLLLEASALGATTCCRTLVQHGVDPNVRAEWGDTAMILAAEAGHDETVLALLALGGDFKAHAKFGRTVLTTGAGKCRTETIMTLLDVGADANAMDVYHTPLSAAAEGEKVQTMQLLLDRGAKVNGRPRSGLSALAQAARSGDPDSVELLVRAGAKADERGQESPLIQAMADKEVDLEVVRLLLDNWANPNVSGESDVTPLQLAIEYGRADLVKELLRHGARVNTIDSEQMTPLDMAEYILRRGSQSANPKIVVLLKAAGGRHASEIRHRQP